MLRNPRWSVISLYCRLILVKMKLNLQKRSKGKKYRETGQILADYSTISIIFHHVASYSENLFPSESGSQVVFRSKKDFLVKNAFEKKDIWTRECTHVFAFWSRERVQFLYHENHLHDANYCTRRRIAAYQSTVLGRVKTTEISRLVELKFKVFF